MLQLFTVFKVSLILGIIGALILGQIVSLSKKILETVVMEEISLLTQQKWTQFWSPSAWHLIVLASCCKQHIWWKILSDASSESTNPTLIDYTLFTEIFSSETGPAFFPERTIFAVTRCERTLEGENLSCESSPIPHEKINLTRCFEYFVSPFSIKMNTVLVNSSGKSIPNSITTRAV